MTSAPREPHGALDRFTVNLNGLETDQWLPAAGIPRRRLNATRLRCAI
jgi:hypothetical protein